MKLDTYGFNTIFRNARTRQGQSVHQVEDRSKRKTSI